MNLPAGEFGTILADPPWRFSNRTVRGSPEEPKAHRYHTMPLEEILSIEIPAGPTAHLYLWVPNALLPDGLSVMAAWGFNYKTNLVWCKTKRDGSIHGGGWGGTSEPHPSCVYLASKVNYAQETMEGRSLTSSCFQNVSTPENRTNSTTSSKRAPPART